MARTDNDSGKDNGELIIALETRNQLYAEMVRNALETEGIPSILKSPMGTYLRGMFPIRQSYFDYRLYVREDHIQRVRDLIEMIIPAEEL